ncbi:MAG TPA: Eco57I restriction-modification methylase domain-containing protein [Pirellulales bacterium]
MSDRCRGITTDIHTMGDIAPDSAVKKPWLSEFQADGSHSTSMTASLTKIAAEQQWQFDATTLAQTKKERGHFGTAPAIADFMAGMFRPIARQQARVLDAGAGVGTLSAALCQRFLDQQSASRLYFELWENDPRLHARLSRTMESCRDALRNAGHEMDFVIRTDDFILEHGQPSLFHEASGGAFDLAIMNPPYFKVRKDSDIAQAMAHVVYGQPNIYVFFMAVAADLLSDGGQLVVITPRSYFNGPYFKRFRKWFFDRMTVRQIHVFESRDTAFREDQVLQENVILLAEKKARPQEVLLTSSRDRSFNSLERHALPYASVVEGASGDHLIRVATNALERKVVEAVDALPCRFRDLPFRISTGPVVTFRATEFLCIERAQDTAPLLWMHNVRPFAMRFRPKNGKPMHIRATDDSMRLLLPAKRYVLLKRFTAKEERRRLVAGIVEATDSYAPLLGLENHLNYVYRPDGELTRDEALGLAAFFNSALIDRYFRAISGNTQVNAAEIRAMPVPDVETIRKIGKDIAAGSDTAPEAVERIVGKAIGIPATEIAELCEIAT